MNPQFWRGRKVLLTGHTGFKGSWLSLMLAGFGARLVGYALPAEPVSLFRQAGVDALFEQHVEQDIRDPAMLAQVMAQFSPELVIHLAAQPLVRRSYAQPLETWSSNVMGTAHLLEAVRHCPSVQAVLVVTSDKCYQNQHWQWGYRESDPLGGHDPYSASKAATELVVQSYRQSYFDAAGPLLATARAGNVIGGGDWSEDRLIPDIVRGMQHASPARIRFPGATRPWQHVLSCLDGYLTLSERLLAGERNLAQPFNFGPAAADNVTVLHVLQALQASWPALRWELGDESPLHEAALLALDATRANLQLAWRPALSLAQGVQWTADWYRQVLAAPGVARGLTEQQIADYLVLSARS